jgi:hypothetical protein
VFEVAQVGDARPTAGLHERQNRRVPMQGGEVQAAGRRGSGERRRRAAGLIGGATRSRTDDDCKQGKRGDHQASDNRAPARRLTGLKSAKNDIS